MATRLVVALMVVTQFHDSTGFLATVRLVWMAAGLGHSLELQENRGHLPWLRHRCEQQLGHRSHHLVYGHQYGHHFQLGELHVYLLQVASLLVVMTGTYLAEVQAAEMSAWLV